MATLVLTQEIQNIEGINKVEGVSETDQVEVAMWRYRVSRVGVRYYTYDLVLAKEEADIWKLDQLVACLCSGPKGGFAGRFLDVCTDGRWRTSLRSVARL